MKRRSLADHDPRPKKNHRGELDTQRRTVRVDLLAKHKFILAVARDVRLSSGAKATTAYLLECYSDDASNPKCLHPGWAYPGFGRIAKATGLDRQTVVRAVAQLEALGCFEIRHAPKGAHNRAPNLYRPVFDFDPSTRGVNASSSAHASSSVDEPRLEASTRSTRGVNASLFHSNNPLNKSKRAVARVRTTDVVGKVKANGHDPDGSKPDPIKSLTFDAAIKEIVAEDIGFERGFEAFLSLWPKAEAKPSLTRRAWAYHVESSKQDVRAVLLATLAWNLYSQRFPKDYVPLAGQWLKNSGWDFVLPYSVDHEGLDCLDEALCSKSSERTAAIQEWSKELQSPFVVLKKLGDWPDRDFQVANNAFNAILANRKNHSFADVVLERAKKLIRKYRDEKKSLPKLGSWLAKRFGEDQEEEEKKWWSGSGQALGSYDA